MNKYRLVSLILILGLLLGVQVVAQEDVTLRVMTWQNPPMVEWLEAFNEQFTAETGINVDYSVVNASDVGTVTQTRLSANDIDVLAFLNSFANRVQPFMSDVNPPSWQTVIDAGLLLDLTDQPFLDNFDAALMLKAIIKESVREVMREEWFKFFEMLIPYVDDVEQADIEATFNPVDYKDDDFVDITDWFNHEAQD
jgi:hypothetical protein